MKKCRIITAMLLVLCLAGVLMGCGAKRYKFKPESTSVFFTTDGQVKEAIFDTLDEDYLSTDGLKAFVEEEISQYNEGLDPAPVSLVSFAEGEDGVICLEVDYDTCGDYMDFNYNDSLVQDVKTASMEGLSGAGISLDGEFVKAKDQKAVELSEVQKLTKGYVLTGTASEDGDVTVYAEGKIKYVSSNITEVEKNRAKVPAGETFTIIYE